jgi:hypothetical protein
MCCREAFHRLGVQSIEVLILVHALFMLGGEGEEKERKKEKKSLSGRQVSPGLNPPCCLCRGSQLLGATKG